MKVIPEAVEVDLSIIRRSFEKHSAHKVVGTKGWLFLTVLKKSTDEKNMLL